MTSQFWLFSRKSPLKRNASIKIVLNLLNDWVFKATDGPFWLDIDSLGFHHIIILPNTNPATTVFICICITSQDPTAVKSVNTLRPLQWRSPCPLWLLWCPWSLSSPTAMSSPCAARRKASIWATITATIGLIQPSPTNPMPGALWFFTRAPAVGVELGQRTNKTSATQSHSVRNTWTARRPELANEIDREAWKGDECNSQIILYFLEKSGRIMNSHSLENTLIVKVRMKNEKTRC